jgi:hypothetical protein
MLHDKLAVVYGLFVPTHTDYGQHRLVPDWEHVVPKQILEYLVVLIILIIFSF